MRAIIAIMVCAMLSACPGGDDDVEPAVDAAIDAAPGPDAWCSPIDETCSDCGHENRGCCAHDAIPRFYCDEGLICDPVVLDCVRLGGGDENQ